MFKHFAGIPVGCVATAEVASTLGGEVYTLPSLDTLSPLPEGTRDTLPASRKGHGTRKRPDSRDTLLPLTE